MNKLAKLQKGYFLKGSEINNMQKSKKEHLCYDCLERISNQYECQQYCWNYAKWKKEKDRKELIHTCKTV